MTLRFRNVDADPAAPVVTWPTEAVQAALERGGLAEWRRLVAEIKRQPWGHTARQVEEVLSHSRPYGVAEVMEDVIAQARAASEQSERAEVSAEIRAAIEKLGMSRAEFASATGTSASRLSTYVTGKVTPSAAYMVRVRRLLSE